MVLESHVVYSLSKEKTAAHFYIMQSTQSIREDLQVPIKDVLERLLVWAIVDIYFCVRRAFVLYMEDIYFCIVLYFFVCNI
ncbi:unnamed protein product [Camellia sinensis]